MCPLRPARQTCRSTQSAGERTFDRLVDVEKRCSTCGEVKPLDDFHRNRSKPDGRQAACKPCNIERNKRWYREHPEARATRMDGYATARRVKAATWLYRYLLEHPCVDCGESDPVVLEFDHLRDKVRAISTMLGSSRQRIEAEIAKCEVVCANCHRRRSARRGGWFRFLQATIDRAEHDPTI